MLKYILKRIGYSILVLLGVSLIMYFLVRLMPVDYIQSKIDQMNQGGATVQLDTQFAMYDTYGLEYPDKLIEAKIADLTEKINAILANISREERSALMDAAVAAQPLSE